MVSLTHHARKKSDNTLHLRVPDLSQADTIRVDEPFSLWKVGDLPLLYHWLDYAVNEGYTRLLIYCSDRPVVVTKAMEKATLWPIEWDIIQDNGEAEHPGCRIANTLPGFSAPADLSDGWRLMDHWFELERKWLEKRASEDSELSLSTNGVGRWCQIHPSTVIHEPVWIGDHVRVGPESEIGPYVSIGDGCVLNGQNRVANSKVADHTFMGRHTELDLCYLEGGRLLNCKYRGAVDRVEPFIAGDLKVTRKRPSWRERLVAFRLWLKIVRMHGLRVVGRAPFQEMQSHQGMKLRQLDSEDFLICRAPLFFQAALGNIFLYGLLPRTAAQVESLSSRDRRAIAQAPVGAISMADVLGVHSADDPRESDMAMEQILSQPGQIKKECGRYLAKLLQRARK